MRMWCRMCRDWKYQDHFQSPNGQWEACGNAPENSKTRYQAGNPLCGDVWQLRDGRYMVVDYIDSFCVGVTFSDGARGSQGYRDGFRSFLEQNNAKLISTFEEWPFRWCDHRGWTTAEQKKMPLKPQDTLDFLAVVLKGKET